MSKIVTIYHSGYGHTKKLAEAVHAALQGAGADAELIAIDAEGNIADGAWDTLSAADAIVFGSPTYMGMASWQFKKFADASSKVWFVDGWRNKIMAGFTNSASMNGDKHSTLHYFATLAMQHGGIWVGPALKPSNTKSAVRDDINYLGSYMGLMSQSPADASATEAPTQGDLATAKLFGERIVEVTRRLAG